MLKPKTVVIHKECSPSKRISHEETPAKEILISYGGGMGGASHTYYGTVKPKKGDKTMLIVHDYKTDEIVEINRKFVVSMTDKKLLTVVTDVTAHRNYNDRKFKSFISTVVSIHKANDTFVFDDVGSASSEGLKILMKDSDIVKA